MKKIKFLFICFILFYNCSEDTENKINLYQFIPQNTKLVLQINEGSIFKEVWKKNQSLKCISPSNKETEILISLNDQNLENKSLLCFSPVGKEKLSTILIQIISSDSIKKYSKNEKYSGVNIIQDKIEGIEFYSAKINKINIVSSSKLMVENIIRNFQNNQPGISDKDFFRLIKNIEEKSVFNIIINKNSNLFLNQFLPKTNLFPNFNENWIALDGDFKTPLVGLDGIILTKDSIPSRIGVYKNLEPKKIKNDIIIPQNFYSFLSFPIENIPQLEDNLKKYSSYHNLAIKNKPLSGFNSIDEVTLFNHKEGKGLIIHRTNKNQPIISLEIFDKSFRNISYGKIDRNPEALSTILNFFNIDFKVNFSSLIDDYYVLTDNESLIKTVISSYKDNKTINYSDNYLSIIDDLSDLSSGIWVSKTESFFDMSDEKFNSTKYPLVAMQWVGDEDISHLHLRFGSDVTDNKKNSVINQGNISSNFPIAIKPKWLKNHRSKGYDIAFQDENNTLFLYSNKGNLFWKKELSEKIIGEILQVDLFKNKKLQMAFRTKNHFMILDRNGKIVKPFNKKIKSSSNPIPLSVFDYDNSRDYRFLIAQDKNVMMLDPKGKKVKGFKFENTKSEISNPPKHIRIKGKDFIIIREENGVINILNRRGKNLIKLKSNLSLSKNSIYSYLNTFATSDIYGNLVQIDTKGNVIKTPENLAPGHYIEMTTKTLVSLSENILTIKGIPVKLPYGNYTKPKIFYINNTIYVSTTDIDSQKVYLYLSNGKLVNGFPVYGSDSADIVNSNNKNSLEMIVQSESNGIIIYQIN
tara:strand:- start:4731 stop:7151 length:2421 start_codon:yes stop_codon:yes gene_type:complete